MDEQTAERTAFGRVLGRVMEARGLATDEKAIRALAERSGLDAEKFVARATNSPLTDLGPLTGLDEELGLSQREMDALAHSYIFEDRPTAAAEGGESWTPEERAWWDAKAEEEAWEFAESVLRPWVEAARPIGSDELTRVMEKALAEVEEAVAAARGRLERAESEG